MNKTCVTLVLICAGIIIAFHHAVLYVYQRVNMQTEAVSPHDYEPPESHPIKLSGIDGCYPISANGTLALKASQALINVEQQRIQLSGGVVSTVDFG